MLTQLRTIFDLIIQFQNAQESFFSAATAELQSRQRLEKAVELRTDEVRSRFVSLKCQTSWRNKYVKSYDNIDDWFTKNESWKLIMDQLIDKRLLSWKSQIK